LALLRQIFKPLYLYFTDADYRCWLRVKKECASKKEKSVTVFFEGYLAEGNNGESFLHQYEEIIRRKSYDFNPDNNSPVIWICGANIGLEVLHFNSKYADARIRAYEPDPQLHSILKSNIDRNDFKAQAINAAVSDFNGEIPFAADGKLGGKTGIGSMNVKAVRLKEELSGVQSIDLLIMDIEGAESSVLADCRNEICKVKNLFVEWHSPVNEKQNLSQLLQLLSDCGFHYRLNNNLGVSPFLNPVTENGFDAMVEIYAVRTSKP
jgi:FkbM family methyltransferase